jgi:hypothetical protein
MHLMRLLSSAHAVKRRDETNRGRWGSNSSWLPAECGHPHPQPGKEFDSPAGTDSVSTRIVIDSMSATKC